MTYTKKIKILSFLSFSYSLSRFVFYSSLSHGRFVAWLTRIMSQPMFTWKHNFQVLLEFKTCSNNFHCTSNENGHHFVPFRSLLDIKTTLGKRLMFDFLKDQNYRN